jgi:protein TonB
MVVKSVTPDYPQRAQRKKLEGYVDLHFTASTEGDVKDVVVSASEPQGVFDEAAVRAIKRWKFKPKEVDGQVIEQRLGLRMRFELQDD